MILLYYSTVLLDRIRKDYTGLLDEEPFFFQEMTEGALIGFREFSPEKEEERAGVKVGVKEV